LCWEADAPFETAHADTALMYHAWRNGINAPQSSAAGRVFDAAASLTGVLQVGSFEGQGPMYLEALAMDGAGIAIELPLRRDDSGLWQTDWAPLLARIRDESLTIVQRAADVHATLAHALCLQALQLAKEQRFTRIGLTVGVFQNARLAELAIAELTAAGFRVSLPERLPCNDAGISFGQVMEALYAH
jgi:hydrogenase maturation protein HypF